MANIVKKDPTAITTELASLMAGEMPVDSRDFLIPKILLMQSTSELVKQEKARAGEIRGSVDTNKIADREGKVEIIPFTVYKTWVTFLKKGSTFVRQVPFTPENCTLPREEMVDGHEVVNFETLNYYCLLPDEIKAGMFMPYVVSFRSTSYTAGKTLESMRAKLAEFKKPLPFKTFWLSSNPRKNDKGSFYAYGITESRNTTDAELEAVKKWYQLVKGGGARVDESELHSAPAESATVAETDEF